MLWASKVRKYSYNKRWDFKTNQRIQIDRNQIKRTGWIFIHWFHILLQTNECVKDVRKIAWSNWRWKSFTSFWKWRHPSMLSAIPIQLNKLLLRWSSNVPIKHNSSIDWQLVPDNNEAYGTVNDVYFFIWIRFPFCLQ